MNEDEKRVRGADKPSKKGRLKRFLKRFVMLFLNPRFLLCFGIAWIITNGWSYIMMALGVAFDVGWMIAVSGAYLAFLWLPISPEKLVTFAIAIFFDKADISKRRAYARYFAMPLRKSS